MEAGTPALGLESEPLDHQGSSSTGVFGVHLGSPLGCVIANHSRERGSAMRLEAAPGHQLGAL